MMVRRRRRRRICKDKLFDFDYPLVLSPPVLVFNATLSIAIAFDKRKKKSHNKLQRCIQKEGKRKLTRAGRQSFGKWTRGSSFLYTRGPGASRGLHFPESNQHLSFYIRCTTNTISPHCVEGELGS
jgi:hypothetical protein